MIRKLIAALVLIPLAAILVMFAVANRQIVTVAFDPFDTANPAASLTLPLFLLVFVLVGLGVLIGGMAAWLRQHHWRVRARQAESENRRLRERIGRGAPAPARTGTQVSAPYSGPYSTHPPVAVPPAA